MCSPSADVPAQELAEDPGVRRNAIADGRAVDHERWNSDKAVRFGMFPPLRQVHVVLDDTQTRATSRQPAEPRPRLRTRRTMVTHEQFDCPSHGSTIRGPRGRPL